MSRRKTKEEVNKQLEDAGRYIRLKTNYINALTKTLFECEHNHTWMVRPNDVLNGHGCPECAGLSQSSKEKVNEQLSSRGSSIKMIGDYINALTKSEFMCGSGHSWSARPNDILSGRGCPTCSDTTLSIEIINRRLQDQGRTIRAFGEYTNSIQSMSFCCELGHEWHTSASNVLRGSGCPICADYGFNPAKEGWEYILDFGHFIKYGITNDLTRRLNEHSRCGSYNMVHSLRHDVGQLASDWEKVVKMTLGGNYVSRDIMPNGFTETLPIGKLEELLALTIKHKETTWEK
jgi:hypothetical protein